MAVDGVVDFVLIGSFGVQLDLDCPVVDEEVHAGCRVAVQPEGPAPVVASVEEARRGRHRCHARCHRRRRQELLLVLVDEVGGDATFGKLRCLAAALQKLVVRVDASDLYSSGASCSPLIASWRSRPHTISFASIGS